MNIFNLKTTHRQIEIFEQNVAEILKVDFPEIKKSLESSTQKNTIQFSKKPNGIFLLRDYNIGKIIPELENNFDLYGLKVFNKKLKQYQDITLFFNNNALTLIEVEDSEKFHKTYDYNKIQIGELQTKHVSFEDQDIKITLEILKNVSLDKLKQLEIDDAIEIELDENLYYTILNMEDGNFIALDKSGKVYRLNHDHTEKSKKISNNIDDFFVLYKGNKSNLIEIMDIQKTQTFYGTSD